MTSVSTHVLDLVRGGPAAGITVTLDHWEDGGWRCVGSGVTNEDGRIPSLFRGEETGTFQASFSVGSYLEERGNPGFYPYVPIVFQVREGGHFHVPLLLGPFGYSTYRGS